MGNDSKVLLIDETRSPLQLVESVSTPTGEYTGAVIATLFGTLSDYSQETRNGRWYTGDLWKDVLDSELFKEALATKTLLGEADHPLDVEDRLETHIPYVSHVVRDPKINEGKQCVEGYLDILDTPNGRIVKTLLEYGCILGVSSRGSGDLTHIDGRTVVDKNTYNFITWDIVVRPSNKKARMHEIDTIDMKTGRTAYESLKLQISEMISSDNKSGLKLAESLISKSDIPDKEEILKSINESYEYDDRIQDEKGTTQIDDENLVLKSDLDDAYEKVLQLKSENDELDIKNKSLITELADKDNTISELVRVNENLTSMVSSYMSKNKAKESIELSDDTTEDKSEKVDELENEEEISQYDTLDEHLTELLSDQSSRINKRFEELSKKFDQVIKSNDSSKDIDSLTDKIDELTDDNKTLKEQLNNSQNENIRLIRKTSAVINEYFKLRCSQLGINESVARREFNNRLHEYDLSDINEVLNELYMSGNASSKLNESSNLSDNKLGSLTLTGQVRSKSNVGTDKDDDIDSSLVESIRQTRNA